jgi:peptidoglycan/xylan/chitin deacetylase (PgdA/CDA1 family)
VVAGADGSLMIDIVRPSEAEVIRLQAAEAAFYWSGCAEALLRRHGILNVRTSQRAGEGFALVCRNVRWEGGGAAVVEGPVHADTLAALGLIATVHTCTSLRLRHAGNVLPPLGYPSYRTRPTPDFGGAATAPRAAVVTDPRWSRRGIAFQSFLPAPGWKVFLEAETGDGDLKPVGMVRGDVVVLGVPYLDLLCAEYAFPPLKEGYWDRASPTSHRPEEWFIELLLERVGISGHPVVRVDSWPEGRRWALTIRHDWDRPIGAARLDRLLALYRRRHIKASFGIIAGRTNRWQARRVALAGHEINLHSAAATRHRFESELRMVGELTQSAVRGYHCHGGSGGVGYLGDVQFGWAESSGLDYVELLGRLPSIPSPIVRLDGHVPRVSRLVAPATHLSLDAGTGAADHRLEKVVQSAQRLASAGGHVVLMNHPDTHYKEVRSFVERLELSACWHATLAEVAEWWRVTRVTSSVQATAGGIRLSLASPLEHDVGVTLTWRGGSDHGTIRAGQRELDFISRSSSPGAEHLVAMS